MTPENEAFSRVVIDAQLADQGWSTQAEQIESIQAQQTTATQKAETTFAVLLSSVFST
ncbi:MAG: hypothetical protein ABSG91_09780 [Syntrophobacteraceae bacterium]|jgi:hypothetical protein